jgi:hypothetical protein
MLHRWASYFALFLANDGFNTAFRGKMAYTYMGFGDGVYIKDRFDLPSAYVVGLKALTLTKQYIWDAIKEERVNAISSEEAPAMRLVLNEGYSA